MRDRITNAWELLRGSLWFIPALFTLAGIGLAIALMVVDAGLEVGERVYLWRGGAEGAREVLSTIATAIITVAGVAFSITVVALSLAASQYGSLILVNYRRDQVNQTVLGVFVGTFVYCLVVLGNLGSTDGGGEVPTLSVSFSLVLAVISLAAFILFIHRLTRAMQGDHLTAQVGTELLEAIEWIFPEALGLEAEQADGRDHLPEAFESEAWELAAPRVGYLQAVESDRLMAFLENHDLVMKVSVRPGDFLTQGAPLAKVWGAHEVNREEIDGKLRDFFLVGEERTATQDPEFAVLQLTQIAVRALSPGINDPMTALMCIDWLAAALDRLTGRHIPSGHRFDRAGRLRVIAPVPGFEVTADAAFDALRRHSRQEGHVLIRLVEMAGEVGRNAQRQSDRDTLRRHVERLREEGMSALSMAWEKEQLEGCYRSTVALLDRRQDATS